MIVEHEFLEQILSDNWPLPRSVSFIDSLGKNGWKVLCRHWEEGNIDIEPLFADPDNGDYHLKSQAGRWDPAGESWIMDELTSSCIDAGDPNSPVADEPEPNGGRINMGAYGGSAEASKSNTL